jgi:ClpP class serine protease
MYSLTQDVPEVASMLGPELLSITPGYLYSQLAEIRLLSEGLKVEAIEAYQERQRAKALDLFTGAQIGTGSELNQVNKPAIAHIHLSGLLLTTDYSFLRGVHHVARELQEAEENPNVKGILLEVNSGGGHATAGRMLLATLADLRTPVVVFTHFMASAALMATLPAKYVVASSQAVQVGSIGTYLDVNKLAIEVQNKYFKTIYAKKSTRKNWLWRRLLEGDFSQAEKFVEETNDHFIREVKKYRRVKSDTLTGEIFWAKDAIRHGLVGSIGGRSTALHVLKLLILEEGKEPEARAVSQANETAIKSQNVPAAVKLLNDTVNQVKRKAKPGKAHRKTDDAPAWLKNPINQRAAKLFPVKNK